MMASSKKATFDLFGLPMRAQPGDRVLLPSQLEEGDFLRGLGGAHFRVLNRLPDAVIVQEVNELGRPLNNRTRTLRPRSLRERQVHRIKEMKRPDVSFERALGYVDGRHGYPPSSITSRDGYRTWLREKLTQPRGAPFFELGDEELAARGRLERVLDWILQQRHVDDDWAWTRPPAVQVGGRVQFPSQLELGDFLDYYGRLYRVVEADDEAVRVVPITEAGRPAGKARTFDTAFLQSYRVRRAPHPERLDVTYKDLLDFADAHLGTPPDDVRSPSAYRDWLVAQLKNLAGSPYRGLGADEVEHQNALAKQVRRLLGERGVGPGWDG